MGGKTTEFAENGGPVGPRNALTVALVGGDGAGKTTVAKKLVEVLPHPAKYLYMGVSSVQAEFALPTTRLVTRLKMRSYRREMGLRDDVPFSDSHHQDMQTRRSRRGAIWNTLRILNRFIEGWYRQIIAYSYLLRGNIVIFDRHFLFDSAPNGDMSLQMLNPKPQLIEFALFRSFFPKPDLTFFLDAPAHKLHMRKRESSVQRLAIRRDAILRVGETLSNFSVLDADTDLDTILESIQEKIVHHLNSKQKSG